jgi:hypothetical protein
VPIGLMLYEKSCSPKGRKKFKTRDLERKARRPKREVAGA